MATMPGLCQQNQKVDHEHRCRSIITWSIQFGDGLWYCHHWSRDWRNGGRWTVDAHAGVSTASLCLAGAWALSYQNADLGFIILPTWAVCVWYFPVKMPGLAQHQSYTQLRSLHVWQSRNAINDWMTEITVSTDLSRWRHLPDCWCCASLAGLMIARWAGTAASVPSPQPRRPLSA